MNLHELPPEDEIDTILLPAGAFHVPGEVPPALKETSRIDISPQHIVFPKSDQPYRADYDVSTQKSEQERTIADCFVDALYVKHEQEFRVLDAERERPDVVMERVSDGAVIGLELTQVCDPAHVRLRAKMRDYASSISDRLGGVVFGFGGVDIELSPLRTGARLPGSRTTAASSIVANIANQLFVHFAFSSLTALRGSTLRRTVYTQLGDSFSAAAQRFKADTLDTVPVVRFQEEYATNQSRVNRLLAEAINAKSSRYNYTDFGEECDEVWLLAWDSYGYLNSSDQEMAAQAASQSPFVKVWSCFLLGQPHTAIVECIFPKPATGPAEQ